MGAPKSIVARARKSVAMSFRFTPETRERLLLAARHENRSQANLLEWLLEDYWRRAAFGGASGARTRDARHGER